MSEFTKYRKLGAYHWRELSLHPGRAHPYTRARIDWVVKQVGDARRVLEIGCGDAAVLGRLARPGVELTGAERDDTGRGLAEQMFRERGLTGRFVRELAELGDAVFDAVVLAEVIEHVEDDRGLLAEIGRRLAPGGRLVLTTPVRKAEVISGHHVREYWPSELRALLEGAFTDVRTELFQPSWLFDLMEFQLLGRFPGRIALNLLWLTTGIELLNRARSPWDLYWTQGAVCSGPRGLTEAAAGSPARGGA